MLLGSVAHKSFFKSFSQIPAGPIARGRKKICPSPQPVPGNAALLEVTYLEAPPLTLGCIFLTKWGPGCTEGFRFLPELEQGGLMDTRAAQPCGTHLRGVQSRAGYHTHTHAHSVLLLSNPFPKVQPHQGKKQRDHLPASKTPQKWSEMKKKGQSSQNQHKVMPRAILHSTWCPK